MLKNKAIGAVMGAALLSLGSLSADVVHPNGCKGPTLCTSNPVVDSCGWSFEVGLILEQMRVTNTDVAFYNVGGGDGTAASPTTTQNMINLGFDLEPGLRVSVGHDFDHDDWKVKADFEWLYSNAKYNDTVDTGNFYIVHQISEYSSTTDLINEPQYRTLNANLEVDYFLLDVYLSRGSYFSGHFSYSPFAGIKASWINFKGAKKFSNDSDTSRLAANTAYLMRDNVDFWGVGPMVGMDGNYHICAGWSVFSSANLAILFGQSHLKNYYGFVTTEAYPGGTLTRSKLDVLSPTMRGIIGVQYDQDVFDDTQHFSFRAGFDSRYYFNQYPIIEYVARRKSESSASDLRLQGNPNTIENGSWGMLGLLLDVAYDF